MTIPPAGQSTPDIAAPVPLPEEDRTRAWRDKDGDVWVWLQPGETRGDYVDEPGWYYAGGILAHDWRILTYTMPLTPLVSATALAAAEQETAEARAELDAVKKNRLISAIFGHHRDAPKPFALYRREDETGISGTGVVALGAEFPDGMVVLRWTSAFPTSVVFHERGIESVEAVHGHGGKTQVVWLSDELEPLAEAERKIETLSAEVAGLREQLTQTEAERDRARRTVHDAALWITARHFTGTARGFARHLLERAEVHRLVDDRGPASTSSK